jgi:fused signal recognition particle receptor
MNLLKKIASGLTKTREAVVDGIRTAVGGRKLDEDVLEELEEVLITSDLGVDTTLELLDRLRDRAKSEELRGEGVLTALREELHAMISEVGRTEKYPEKESSPAPQTEPVVTFVVGVNGTGKTTTTGKLAAHYSREGKKVLLVAADTFRNAAVEQLAVWAERAGVDIVRGATGADPGSVVYDGLAAAKSRSVQRVIVDTAGRLHTKQNLMNELGKLDRVAKKQIDTAPHEVLLVVDGGTGQNGLSQARTFTEISGVTGLVVTKLDGTAKGGVLVPIGRELDIPVRWIGLGEGLDDLVPFDADMIVDAVFGGVTLAPHDSDGDNEISESARDPESEDTAENEEAENEVTP